MHKMTYKVTADFLPFRIWLIDAESEAAARMELVRRIGVPYDETSASLALARMTGGVR